jgi:hypothetical protein
VIPAARAARKTGITNCGSSAFSTASHRSALISSAIPCPSLASSRYAANRSPAPAIAGNAPAGAAPDSYVVALTVTGDGFNGTGSMNFELRDGRFASLRISRPRGTQALLADDQRGLVLFRPEDRHGQPGGTGMPGR